MMISFFIVVLGLFVVGISVFSDIMSENMFENRTGEVLFWVGMLVIVIGVVVGVSEIIQIRGFM